MSVRRSSIAKALTLTKQFLATSRSDERVNRKPRFICIAAHKAYINKLISMAVYTALLRIIDERLNYTGSFRTWLLDTYPEFADEISDDEFAGNAKMQATRLAWMDSLIAEYSAPKA